MNAINFHKTEKNRHRIKRTLWKGHRTHKARKVENV
jgi:hypothetical protein